MASKGAAGLVGCGTVGSGVVHLWNEAGHAPGVPLVTVAVRNLEKSRTVDLSGITLTGDARALVRDPEIGLVIEATGDAALAHELALECFRRGKSFVTAGKEMVARSGPELEALAQASGAAFRYEAAAGGALPVVALLRLGLAPGAVRGFEGVLNGTCNFILSRLDRGFSFAESLELAKAEGFAEPDSRRDTSGRDTAEKLVILARLCGVRLDPDALAVRGIEGLHPDDAAFGRRRGWSLRLVAAFRDEGKAALGRWRRPSYHATRSWPRPRTRRTRSSWMRDPPGPWDSSVAAPVACPPPRRCWPTCARCSMVSPVAP